MKFESLKTQRLTLRRLSPEDTSAIVGYRNLPEITRFQSWDSYSDVNAAELIESMKDADPSLKGRWFQFGIELTSQKKLIGDIGFLNTDDNEKSWLSFTLHPKFWNQGYATEAVSAILNNYADFGVSELWASTDPENKSASRLLSRLGFTLLETRPDALIFKKEKIRPLKIEDKVFGTGKYTTYGALIVCQYQGFLENGTTFDSSYDHGRPFQFVMGAGKVICGWDLGLLGMKEGGKRTLHVPAYLAYGERSVGKFITPHSNLIFHVELLEVRTRDN